MLAAFCCMASMKAYAQLITSREGGTTLYYNVLSESEVEVTYPEGELTTYSGAITIPESITYFGKQLSVTRIGDYAFDQCTGLTSISIPGSVKSIGSLAFRGCKSLTEVTIPGSVKSIEESAFQACTHLKSVTISEGVTSIESWAFAGCDMNLIVLPSSITSIGHIAFRTSYENGNYPVTFISLIEEPFEIETGILPTFDYDPGIATLYVPYGTKSKYEAIKGWAECFTSIEEGTPITISAAGKGTYCGNYDLDFAGIDGLKAYIASGYDYNTGTVMLSRVEEVPAGMGVMLIGEPGTYPVLFCSSQYYYMNLFKGTLEATMLPTYENGYTNYILQNGPQGVMFYGASNTTLGANKAYLQIPTPSANGRSVLNYAINDDTVTGIEQPEQLLQEKAQQNDAIYNLNGQRTEHPQKGIYIRNGKKIIIH